MNSDSGLFEVLRDVAAVIGAIVTVGGFLVLVARTGRRLFVATLGQQRIWYSRLKKLAPDVYISHFHGLLGEPTFKNVTGSLEEYVYVHKYFYIQAVTDANGGVLFFSVTRRRKEFRPQVWGQEVGWSPDRSTGVLQLGKFAFARLKDVGTPDGARSWLGANRFHFSESYYFGNPGSYQTYILGLNQAGFMDDSTKSAISLLGAEERLGALGDAQDDDEVKAFLNREEIREFRSKARPNLYGVASQRTGYRSLGFIETVGPDYGQVRVLRE